MKALKFTLIVALFLAIFTSCTKQDIGEDDVLVKPNDTEAFFNKGDVDETQ